MTGITLRRAVFASAVVALALFPAAPALAHGDVAAGDGDLVLTIGFVNEPAFAGMPNGVAADRRARRRTRHRPEAGRHAGRGHVR